MDYKLFKLVCWEGAFTCILILQELFTKTQSERGLIKVASQNLPKKKKKKKKRVKTYLKSFL